MQTSMLLETDSSLKRSRIPKTDLLGIDVGFTTLFEDQEDGK